MVGKIKRGSVAIGLEIHITLKSTKKSFSWVDTYSENASPNSQVGPWELGYLGTLPILNPQCLELALRLALALGSQVKSPLIFDRKIYHYYDLPKGYQVTQYRQPLASGGYLPLITEKGLKKVPLKNLQLEEDTAKAFYQPEQIRLDFNRSGNPLVELTTEPVFTSTEEVTQLVEQLQSLLRYLDISEAKMEKGQLRVDLNFSFNFSPSYQTARYEVKNLNSLRALEKALEYETSKHQNLYQAGVMPPRSQTYGFSEKNQITIVQRAKTDYFYLPENNLPPIWISPQEQKRVRQSLPLLPWEFYLQIQTQGVSYSLAKFLSQKPFLLKTLTYLTNKLTLSPWPYQSWSTFYLNYLSPLLAEKDSAFFARKWKAYWQLYQLSQTKQWETGQIKLMAEQLTKSSQSFKQLFQKHRSLTSFSPSWLHQELAKLWNASLAQKYLINRQKVNNFLLGQIKKRFPQLAISQLSELVSQFSQKQVTHV